MELIPLLTVAEVSAFLKLKPETVYVLIAKDGLPAAKVGGQWRFDLDEIRSWFRRQYQTAQTN